MNTRTHDEPNSITEVGPDTYAVRLKQVVRALSGSLLSTGEFDHVHHVRNGMIVRMRMDRFRLPVKNRRARAVSQNHNGPQRLNTCCPICSGIEEKPMNAEPLFSCVLCRRDALRSLMKPCLRLNPFRELSSD